MTVSDDPGSLKRLRRTPWKFQQTFATPLKDLPNFVVLIIGANQALSGASLTVDQVVFEPKHLKAMALRHSITAPLQRGVSFTAENREEAEALLLAGLGDWVDFAFFPKPKPFVIYADHDEYTTFFASTRSNLDAITHSLKQQGFTTINGYERKW
jgi:hypothetical protein